MIFKVYDDDKYITQYTINISSLDGSFSARVRRLMNSYNNIAFINRELKGTYSHKVYITGTELYYLLKLYTYQNNYQIYISDSRNDVQAQIYFIGDFNQKKLAYKDALSHYDISIAYEILNINLEMSYFDNNIFYGSNDFMRDASDTTDFQTKYPQYILSSTNQDISVSNGYLTSKIPTVDDFAYTLDKTKYSGLDGLVFRFSKVYFNTSFYGRHYFKIYADSDSINLQIDIIDSTHADYAHFPTYGTGIIITPRNSAGTYVSKTYVEFSGIKWFDFNIYYNNISKKFYIKYRESNTTTWIDVDSWSEPTFYQSISKYSVGGNKVADPSGVGYYVVKLGKIQVFPDAPRML